MSGTSSKLAHIVFIGSIAMNRLGRLKYYENHFYMCASHQIREANCQHIKFSSGQAAVGPKTKFIVWLQCTI